MNPLTRPQYGLDRDLAESLIRSQLDFLDKNSDLLEARVREGRIIEAHGDLRPEHVCLEAHRPPASSIAWNSIAV